LARGTATDLKLVQLRLFEEVDLRVRQLEGAVHDLLDLVLPPRAPHGRPARGEQPSGRQHPRVDDLPEGVRPGRPTLLAVEVVWHGRGSHAHAVTVLPDPTPCRLHQSLRPSDPSGARSGIHPWLRVSSAGKPASGMCLPLTLRTCSLPGLGLVCGTAHLCQNRQSISTAFFLCEGLLFKVWSCCTPNQAAYSRASTHQAPSQGEVSVPFYGLLSAGLRSDEAL
jgi:hypothetical protein